MEEETTEKTKGGSITIKKDTLWKYSTFALVGILVLGAIFFVLSSKSPTGNVVAPPNSPPSKLPGAEAKVNIEIQDGDYFKGDVDAPVTIFEFSDFECPFCGRFYSQTLSQIEREYIDTGKVKLVYKHFPLSFHQQSEPAAEAYECAGEQGKAWEMHDLLFESGVQGGVSSFKIFAGQLGLDQSQFDNCLDSSKYADKIKADIAQGSASGIRGTPGFFINGKLVSGAQPFSAFKQVIDAELS